MVSDKTIHKDFRILKPITKILYFHYIDQNHYRKQIHAHQFHTGESL